MTEARELYFEYRTQIRLVKGRIKELRALPKTDWDNVEVDVASQRIEYLRSLLSNLQYALSLLKKYV